MEEIKKIEALIKELGLTPQQVAEHWIENSTIDPFLFIEKSDSKTAEEEQNVYFDDAEKQALFEHLSRIIARTLRVNITMIKPVSDLCFDLGADSLAKVELLQRIEKEFDFMISDQEADQILTVQDLLNFCLSRK